MSTKFYADTSGKYLGGYSGSTPVGDVVEVPFPPENSKHIWDGITWKEVKTLAEALLERGNKFKADMQTLQLRWLAVAVADGVDELSKKAVVEQDIVELKIQYTADIAAIKASYL